MNKSLIISIILLVIFINCYYVSAICNNEFGYCNEELPILTSKVKDTSSSLINISWNETYADNKFARLNGGNNLTGPQYLNGNLSLFYNITEQSFPINFITGQPIDGEVGSGIIWSLNYTNKASLYVNSTGLSVTYPNFTVRLATTNMNITYCNIIGSTIVVPDNQHTVYYINSTCGINNISFAQYIQTPISPGGVSDFFNVMTHSGTIEMLYGNTLQQKITIKNRLLTLLTGNLQVINGFIFTPSSEYKNFSISSGQYQYISEVVDFPPKNTSTGSEIEILYHTGASTWGYNEQSKLNTTSCDTGTGIADCTSGVGINTKVRRHFIFAVGTNSTGSDTSELHQLLPLQNLFYSSLANCMDTITYPITYTLPPEYQYVSVPLYAICLQSTDTTWSSNNIIDLRTTKTGTSTGIFNIANTITGNGFEGYIPVFNGTSTINNSVMFQQLNKILINRQSSLSSNNAMLEVFQEKENGNVYGLYVDVRENTSTTLSNGGLTGIYNINRPVVMNGLDHAGIVNVAGINNYVRRNNLDSTSNDNGTMSYLVGIANYYGHWNTNTTALPKTTNVYGIYMSPAVLTGNVSTMIDLYIIGPANPEKIRTHYAIYQTSTTATNYFGGNIGIASTPNALSKLQIGGFFKDTSSLGINNLQQHNVSVNGAYDGVGFSSQIDSVVATGRRNTGSIVGTQNVVYRNSRGATSDDSGNLTALYGGRFSSGHLNTNTTASPFTSTIYGVASNPFMRTGNATTLYGVYIGAVDGDDNRIVNNYGLYQAGENGSNYFAGKVGIGNTAPIYPLTINNNVTNISIWVASNISATGYITRTTVYDKSKGSALNNIKDSSEYLNIDGTINHSKMYGYTSGGVETDFSRPVLKNVCVPSADNNGKLIEKCTNQNVYPYTKPTEGVLLDAQVALCSQAIVEIKNCAKNSKTWEEFKSCIG